MGIEIAIAGAVLGALSAGGQAYGSHRTAEKTKRAAEGQAEDEAALIAAQKKKEDMAGQQEAMVRERARLRGMAAGSNNKGGTMLTGPLGIPSGSYTGQKTLLGM
jgi:hypothetical protein